MVLPWQTAVDGLALMLTETGDNGVTEAVNVLEVAGLPDAQLKLEVKIQVMRSLLVGA